MPQAVFEEMKRYIGFGPADAENLRALGPYLEPYLPATVERFYQEIVRSPGARAVVTGGEAQLARLRASLLGWLRSLFGGTYDAGYCRARLQIGRAHVQVGLPQHYMFGAMEILWQDLAARIRGGPIPGAQAKLDALHKLLTLETAVMLETYKLSYAEQVRRGERQAVHERLTEAEHLAQIGALAASLAHEIKNPLAGISGAVQVIRDATRSQDPHYPILGEVLRQINRLDGTVKDLLVYARPKPPRFQTCSVPRLVERVLTLLHEEPELQRIRLECVHSPNLPSIEADEHQVEQLVTNLLLNAAQASPDGGLVRLTTAARDAVVRLVVEDRGHGMSPDVRRRASEPFFTTKAKGTGLGLPICHKIADAHGGRIEIQSEEGRGTTVAVELPLRPPPTGGVRG